MYKSLQAGRAVAAMLVVLFHLGVAVAAEKYFGIAAFSVPFSFGTAGVEFFFVLSGFIILTVHRDDISRPRKLAGYVKKRLIRIYPAYWMIFLAVFLAALSSSALRDTVPHDILVVLKALLLVPQDPNIAGGTAAPVIAVAWTLQYEMLFYLFFASLIVSRMLSVIIALGVLYLFVNRTGVSSLSFPWSLFFQDYVWLFAMGMAVSAGCRSGKAITKKPLMYAAVGAVMFLSVALDVVADTNMLKEWRTILYGLASSLMIFGLVTAEDQGRVIGGQGWMQILGDSSYALYLIHYPLISVLCKLSLLLQLDRFGIVGAIISYIAILGACLACSVAFNLWIEKPVTAYLRTR